MAANDYVKLWIEDYKLLLEPYSMEERGRIIWAMMDYTASAYWSSITPGRWRQRTAST